MKKIQPILLLSAAVLLLLLSQNCQPGQPSAETGPVNFDPARAPYQRLSECRFFKNEMRQQQPNDRVVPYDLITPLFSDYAHKARFVWMPGDVQAAVAANGDVEFPDHTVLIKTFYYPADFRQPGKDWDVVETRLLVKNAGKWQAYTYIWNEDETDAELSMVGDFKQVNWLDEQGIAQQIKYLVPNKNQCKSCHQFSGEIVPIGPKLRNLNKTAYFPEGDFNQIAYWQRAGLLAAGDFIEKFQPVAAWDDPAAPAEARARAYLDVNCGHCHRAEGSAHTSGLFLTIEEQGKEKLGFCKPPVAAGRGSGGFRFNVQPGQPDSSILVYRMVSDDPGVMMPEVGRAVPHREAVELIREWIAGVGECR